MKVLLSKDVKGLGRKGEVKEVSDGHARNFLIPKHLALPATSAMLATVQKEEAEKEQKIKRQQQLFLEQKNKLDGKTFTITGKSQGQRLFAAIHETEIADVISTKSHLSILPKQVIISQAIKVLGTHAIEIKLTESIHAKVKIQVETCPPDKIRQVRREQT
jgi:large subunit ribosomal protein L9